MNRSMQRILKFAGSRLALNLYFWIVAALLEFGLNFYGRRAAYHYPQKWYLLFRATTTLIFVLVFYVNNLVLVPRYFVAKKYKQYFLILLPLLYLAGLVLSGFFEMLDVHFPKIEMDDVTILNALRVNFKTRWIIFFEAISWVFSLLIYIAVFTVAWYMWDYKLQKRKSEEAQKQQVETELKFLKSQINPHFLFNTLNNLYSLTVTKSDMASEVVAKLSAILRYLLYESNTHEVTFAKEKEIMEAYIDLELLRLTRKDNLHFNIAADKPYTIPPLLWIPILENVFKHGTGFISSDYFIDFRIEINNTVLAINSRNSFKADTKNHLEKNEGIGLINLKKRLDLLYPGKYNFKSGVEGNCYITCLQIELA